jgi:hypothetical protein
VTELLKDPKLSLPPAFHVLKGTIGWFVNLQSNSISEQVYPLKYESILPKLTHSPITYSIPDSVVMVFPGARTIFEADFLLIEGYVQKHGPAVSLIANKAFDLKKMHLGNRRKIPSGPNSTSNARAL